MDDGSDDNNDDNDDSDFPHKSSLAAAVHPVRDLTKGRTSAGKDKNRKTSTVYIYIYIS